MNRLTKPEKNEFIRRCKALAQQNGKRVSYYPAKWRLAMWPGLLITWNADTEHVHIRIRLCNRKAENENWSLVVDVLRGQPRWGYATNEELADYLHTMRKMMVLDDLADV